MSIINQEIYRSWEKNNSERSGRKRRERKGNGWGKMKQETIS